MTQTPTRPQPADASAHALLLRLKTRQLLLVIALDAQRNLGRAAAWMNMSQPAATKVLQQLEDTLGAPLFTRHARGVVPTAYGDVLVRYATQVMADFRSVQGEVAALRAGLTGVLRIGSVPGAVPELLAPSLIDYKSRHPNVAVSVTVETSDVILAQLGRGEVDVMLGRLTAGNTAETIDCTLLLGESQVVVARASHPLFAQASVSVQDLIAWPWILQPPGAPQRGHFEAALRQAGLHPRLDITETSSTIATTALLELSDMLAVMPHSLAAHYARLGLLRVVPLALPVHVPPIYLVTRRDRVLSPAALAYQKQLVAKVAA